MQAIILAAGMGKRLKPLTDHNTKCMVAVNGITIIERLLSQLDGLGLSRIVIVVGYKGDELIKYISSLDVKSPITYINNELYEQTNNIYSLFLARDHLLEEDSLLLESDLIFEDSVLKRVVNEPYPTLALVAKYEGWMDGTVVTLDKDSNIDGILDKKDFEFQDTPRYYKTVNIYRFSKEFSAKYYVPFLEAYIKALGNNQYYEQALKVIVSLNKTKIRAVVLEREAWYEIDDIQDLDIAESVFSRSAEARLTRIQSRYGGYWRYPKLIDFCYLVNPFFPPQRLLDEIGASFETLVRQYPSGMDVNSMLAAKLLGLDSESVIVGNGAAELIKVLMEHLAGRIGIAVPTFDEYPNRRTHADVLTYRPRNINYTYTASDLAEFYENKNTAILILINPDNPSGNYIPKADVLKLARWAQERGTWFVVDESFVDFADIEESGTLMKEEILIDHPNLIVVRSISKSFGVPGLRLGVLASCDKGLIDALKSNIAIWNINSVAEHFMQIVGKYRDDYTRAIAECKRVRRDYIDRLAFMTRLRVIPSQANYVMCEVQGTHTAKELATLLLEKHQILIKDLSSKEGISGQFIRLAVKRPEENDILVRAVKEILG